MKKKSKISITIASWILCLSLNSCSGAINPTNIASPKEIISNQGQNDTITSTWMIANTATHSQIPSPTDIPGVELSQLQTGTNNDLIFAEMINHLNVPVLFEDNKPAFLFDIYDPTMATHFFSQDIVTRGNYGGTFPVCILFPGETAYYESDSLIEAWADKWNTSTPMQLKINYQSLGVPRPDLAGKNIRLPIKNLSWQVESRSLYFTFSFEPILFNIEDIRKNDYRGFIQVGLYDKTNGLLGVADGDMMNTIFSRTTNEKTVTYSFGFTQDNMNFLGQNELNFASRDTSPGNNIPAQVDHIRILVEVLTMDGLCRKEEPTPTPMIGI
jgi:hypothetical protein